jgi:hypothetical protein
LQRVHELGNPQMANPVQISKPIIFAGKAHACMTRQAQNHVVEDAVEALITKSKVELPQR